MILKLLLALLLGAMVLAGGCFLYVYWASEDYLQSVSLDGGFVFNDRQDGEFIERGRHISRTRGCFGCHGERLQGLVFSEQWAPLIGNGS